MNMWINSAHFQLRLNEHLCICIPPSRYVALRYDRYLGPWVCRSVWLIFFNLTVKLYMVGGCQVSRGLSPIEKIAAAVAEAESKMKDGIIVLPSDPSPQNETEIPKENIIKAAVGATARFSCGPNNPADTGVYSELDRMLWRHKSVMIYPNMSSDPNGGSFSYSQTKTGRFFFIHNVSISSAGKVECGVICRSGATERFCVLEEYQFVPKLRAHDVFRNTMRNISTAFLSFAMPCSTRFSCSESGIELYFIWKMNNYFLLAPKQHYLQLIIKRQDGVPGMSQGEVNIHYSDPAEKDGFCQTTLQMQMRGLTGHPPAHIQCWVRADERSQEWFVQHAYVNFI
ncbi:uncharacterized protein LOC129594789 [Paramacrobiotus metropolitanus]|uniref:uncharacterized protein LOC129594789 n=1 Tax=Paramacrobiotus metropolitanus TaxID=2943436 RepID=UPI002445EFF7|nr:uncharacterized protein LOC129594789 [Paramacrobiotus metropolitanus]